jgi:hypothetical protein
VPPAREAAPASFIAIETIDPDAYPPRRHAPDEREGGG